MSRLFRHARAASRQSLAIAYTLIAWPLGIYLMTQRSLWVDAIGVLLTSHALIYSAYLLHDCAHHTVFLTAAGNDRLGTLMGWINGACLASYARLKRKHLRHHADRLDVVTFDYRATLWAAPRFVRQLALALEWAYIPTVELIMRGMIIAMLFRNGTARERLRMVGLLAIRLGGFAVLALISVRAVLLYALAYLIFLTVLRFMDAFQHTYDVFVSRSLEPAPPDPRRTRQYEYENTFSNVLSFGQPLLDLLVLNFGYHNAHHVRPGEPWYRLPALHAELFGPEDGQVLEFSALLASFHRHRVSRVLAENYGEVTVGSERASRFIGAVGVSFLTAV
jgi:fatty acid desaturase